MRHVKRLQTFFFCSTVVMAGYAAADSLAERRADSSPVSQWSQTQPVDQQTAKPASMMHGGMMHHDMMSSGEMMAHCRQMHDQMHRSAGQSAQNTESGNDNGR